MNVAPRTASSNPYHNADLVGRTTRPGDAAPPAQPSDLSWFDGGLLAFADWSRSAYAATTQWVGQAWDDSVEWVGKNLDSIQTGLDVAGMTPIVGAVFDVANAGIHALRGNWGEAAMSIVGAVPGLGDAFAAGNKARKAVDAAHTLDKGLDALRAAKAAEAAKDSARIAEAAKAADRGAAFQKASRATHRVEAPSIGCFRGGTLVSAESGLKPVEAVAPHERVWAYDLALGCWVLKPVVETYAFEYVGPMVSATIAGEQIVSSYHHPYWVVAGAELAGRPTPDHLREAEVPDARLPGRWVDAGDLRPADVVLLMPDRLARVTEVAIETTSETVYNFQVADLHDYAVGRNRVLVHNNAPCNFVPVEALTQTARKVDGPRGGPHSQTKLPWKDGFESHHMPAKSITGLDPEVGPAIQMTRADHLLTSSHASRPGSAVYRAEIEDLLNSGQIRKAMATEIRDVRRAALEGSGDMRKYNNAIFQMLEYVRGLSELPQAWRSL